MRLWEKTLIGADNSESAVKYRRCINELYTTGVGYILFGIWSVIKVIMSAFTGDMMYLLLVFVFALVVLWAHVYVGMGAIRESRGSRKKGYLILAMILMIFNAIHVGYYFWKSVISSWDAIWDTTIASFILDLTITILLFNMIRSHFQIKHLEKERTDQSPLYLTDR